MTGGFSFNSSHATSQFSFGSNVTATPAISNFGSATPQTFNNIGRASNSMEEDQMLESPPKNQAVSQFSFGGGASQQSSTPSVKPFGFGASTPSNQFPYPAGPSVTAPPVSQNTGFQFGSNATAPKKVYHKNRNSDCKHKRYEKKVFINKV